MRKVILYLINLLGRFMGFICRIWPTKMKYIVYLLKRSIITEKNKGYFQGFGKGSLLAPHITLLKPQNIKIGRQSSIMRYCILETCTDAKLHPRLEIKDHVSIGEYSHITCANHIEIGNGVLTGRFVLITDNSHGKSDISEMAAPPLSRSIYSKGPVIIGQNVWIGDKVTILPNVTIGNGAIIAANAVVTKNIPPLYYCSWMSCKSNQIIKTLKWKTKILK